MHTRHAVTTGNVLIGVMILAAIIAGAVAVRQIDTWGEQGSGRQAASGDGGRSPAEIDPALIRYEQTGEISLPMRQARAVAVGPDDRIYVGGDRAIQVFDGNGSPRRQIALDEPPQCLAVGGSGHAFPGRIYVGMADHVELLDPEGSPEGSWDSLGEKALLTSIATSEQDVFVADAGNKIVLRFDTSGRLKNRIGARDDRRRIPGFGIVSPYFDLAVCPDGLLRVVNPLARRIEAYTFDGDLEAFWGETAATVEGFFGCCNPAHFTILPDARFVTAEKGFPRVKIYDGEGKFVCVVAGPEQLAVRGNDVPTDVAADSRGRILVLDPKAKRVRIFEPKPDHSEAE